MFTNAVVIECVNSLRKLADDLEALYGVGAPAKVRPILKPSWCLRPCCESEIDKPHAHNCEQSPEAQEITRLTAENKRLKIELLNRPAYHHQGYSAKYWSEKYTKAEVRLTELQNKLESIRSYTTPE